MGRGQYCVTEAGSAGLISPLLHPAGLFGSHCNGGTAAAVLPLAGQPDEP